jgi:restriction system protein
MTPGEKQTLLEIVDELESSRQMLTGSDAERRVMAVLQPLLAIEGYSVTQPSERDTPVDAVAYRPALDGLQRYSLAIQITYRHHSRSLTLDDIARFMIATVHHAANRAIVVANSSFTPRVRDEVARFVERAAVDIQLLGLTELREWISSLATHEADLDEEARIIVQNLARDFAQLVARNPRALDRVEWRDLERIVAEIFAGLGFVAELTPSSGDEGKDVILECLVRGARRSYVVEVKHWRSGARVGSSAVREFVNVVAREARDGGVFLSTYGYTQNAFEAITEIERERVRFGKEEKVAALCRKYTRAAAGLWSPPEVLADIIFEDTV